MPKKFRNYVIKGQEHEKEIFGDFVGGRSNRGNDRMRKHKQCRR